MDPKQLKPPAGWFEQLALELEIVDEPLPIQPGEIRPPSNEEARLRSEAARELLEKQTEKATWMADYFQLRDAGWPWRVATYIAWASSPRIGREPKSLADLATQVLGLTGPRQIHVWRKKNPAIDEVIATLQAAPLMEHRRDIFQALAASAANPDHRSNPDRKLALEMTGDYMPRTKVDLMKTDVEDLSQLSDAELDQLSRRLLNQGDTEQE